MSVALEEGQEISLPGLVAQLTRVGYRRADLVIETGDLAVRGGLFDVFAPDRDLPLRVELDGDRIASLRVFDPDTQRSRERLTSAVIPPFAAAEDALQARADLEERIGRPAVGGRAGRLRARRRSDAGRLARSRAERAPRRSRAFGGRSRSSTSSRNESSPTAIPIGTSSTRTSSSIRSAGSGTRSKGQLSSSIASASRRAGSACGWRRKRSRATPAGPRRRRRK